MKLNPKRSLVLFSKHRLDNKAMRKNAKLPRTLGTKIQKIRRTRHLTQIELAEKVGISSTYLGFIEQGRYAPSLEVLEKIAKRLGVRVKDIFPS